MKIGIKPNNVTVIYRRADGARIIRNIKPNEIRPTVNGCRCHGITAAIYDAAGQLIGERHPVNQGAESTSDPYANAWHDVQLPGD